jgi:hypothetical protein
VGTSRLYLVELKRQVVCVLGVQYASLYAISAAMMVAAPPDEPRSGYFPL